MLFLIVTIGGGIVVPSLFLDMQRTSLASTSGSIGTDSIDPYENSEGVLTSRVNMLSEFARSGFVYADYGQEREPFSTEISQEEAYQAAHRLAEVFIVNNKHFGLDEKVNSPTYAGIFSLVLDPTISLWTIHYDWDTVCVDSLTGTPIYAKWYYPRETLPVEISQVEGTIFIQELLDAMAVDILELTDSSDYPNEFDEKVEEIPGGFIVHLSVYSKVYNFFLSATILDDYDLESIEFTTSTQVDEN